jgi:hypothetical protein
MSKTGDERRIRPHKAMSALPLLATALVPGARVHRVDAGYSESSIIARQKPTITCRTQVEGGLLTPCIVARRAPRLIAVAGH